MRGSYDIVEAMLLIFVFNGMSTAFLHRKNITIDIIDSFVAAAPRRGPGPYRRRAVDRRGALLSSTR